MVSARNAAGFYRDGLLTIPPTRLVFGRSGWFDVQGQGDVKTSLTLSADGVIPMEVMGLFVEDLSDSSGLMRISSQIRTRELKPEITALITLEDIAYTLPMNGQRLHSLNGTVRIRGEEVSIEGITGRLDTGAFRMGGAARLDGFNLHTLELLAETKALPVSIPDTMELAMDAELSLDVGRKRSRLWADVVILDGVYYRDMQVNLLTGVIDRLLPSQQLFRQKKAAKAELSPALQSLELDVTVKRRGDVKVENNIAVLDLNPDLKITGTLQKPVVNGRVAVTDGVVTFQNNDFTVTKGVIDFLDPHRTRAEVDIRATTKVRDWDITLNLEGDPDNLQLTLTSEPAEEPADILSLLIVGRTSRELTQESTNVTVSPSGMMAELLTTTYGQDIKKATTLDILEFSGSDFSTASGGERMKLTVGKELSRRMTVKYEMETRNTETIQRAVAEYKILENLLLNGYQGTDGTFGTDVIYRYEFR
jgi:autotransporter translocation and assembly factor TamB